MSSGMNFMNVVLAVVIALFLLPILLRPVWFMRVVCGFAALGCAAYAYLSGQHGFYIAAVIAGVFLFLLSSLDRPRVRVDLVDHGQPAQPFSDDPDDPYFTAPRRDNDYISWSEQDRQAHLRYMRELEGIESTGSRLPRRPTRPPRVQGNQGEDPNALTWEEFKKSPQFRNIKSVRIDPDQG